MLWFVGPSHLVIPVIAVACSPYPAAGSPDADANERPDRTTPSESLWQRPDEEAFGLARER
uniref:hypothetical protein n=1 Tax=Streptomyces shenzhenensis TaxID=943815 RepID=UPI001C691F2D